ncbi:alkyl hydroperoxide reductase subunit F [Burkholderiaceae bacterium DAT-1]|nr:alkyl hydroperoxide reductase subunit F [Burkholderiaceae bacterium DAT-1]
MLDSSIAAQLKAYLERVSQPIELIASLDESAASADMRELLGEIAQLSPLVSARFDGVHSRRPSFAIARTGETPRIHFAGLPMGHEFTSLVLALLQTGGHPPKLDASQIEQIRAISGEFKFETFISLTCHNCPDVVQALNTMAVLNPAFEATMIDGGLFQQEIEDRQIMGVPSVYLNGQPFGNGRMSLEEILAKVDTGAAAREAAALSTKDAFDVLVVGGGPSGASAAIYAARKGIRTGVVADRFGGQVLDTLGIENFISVKATEGPKLAMALEQHVKDYEVDIMSGQRVSKIEPAAQTGGLHTVITESGATLKAKALIVATGARWREMNVPGEQEYKTRGVAFCPHCDGPLFKGKRVAVIGGGNSGVEAAIDLAGIVAHVTLLEFGDSMRADAVLQKKLLSLPNVTTIMNAQTTEVTGDGQKVNGLRYKDRVSGEDKAIELEGIFVQIGLVPNSDFLKGTAELSPRGEIIINDRGETSVPGIFAAGDATTVPYKQIIIAMGEGAKASLSAFDYLIRH